MGSERPAQPQAPEAAYRSPLAIVVLDEHGVVTGIGPEARALVAPDGADPVGRPLVDLMVGAPLRDGLRAHIDPVLSGSTDSVRGLPVTRAIDERTTAVLELDVEAVTVAGDRLVLGVLHLPSPPRTTGREPTMLEWIFRHAPESITILDDEGNQILSNAAGAKAFGYSEADGLFSASSSGLVGTLLIHPDDLERARQSFVDRQEGRIPPDAPSRFRVLGGDGSWRWAEALTVDLRHIEAVQGFVVFTRDVTEEVERSRRLFESEAQLSAVIRNMLRPAVLEGPDGVVRFHNGRFSSLLGTPDEEVDRRPLVDLLERLEDRSGLRGSPLRSIAFSPQRSGSLRSDPFPAGGSVLEIEATPVWSDGELLGRFWVFTDVTERVEEERRLRTSLERELTARRLAEERVEQLSEIDRLRTRLVSTVSHELRTPLTTISAAVEHLRTGGVDPDELDRYLAMIERNARRLSDRVEDLLVLGRVESGLLELRFGAVDPVALARDVVAEAETTARDRDVRLALHTTDGPRLEADATRVQQVLQNLVTNAVKFGPRGSTVEVWVEPGGPGWRIEVRDHGPGIPEEERRRVFQPFYRSGTAGAVPGTGLGLAIALGIVQAHGGTLDVVDLPGWGCVMRCELPLRRAEGAG
jgi:PAS domain S-box-containing protein